MICFFPADFVSAKSANLGIHTSKYRSTMLTDFIMLYFLYCICFLLDQFRFLIYFFVLIFWSLVAARQFAGPAIVSFLSTTLPIDHSTTLPLHPSIHPSAFFSTSAFDTLRCSPWFARQSFCHCLHTAETQNFPLVFSYQITERNFKTCTLRPCNLKKSKPKTQTQKPKTLQFLKA